tara:strand:- start:130 stop:1230 length:1101 start_codon:yes stop_codon:yes gene_type:complete
MRVASVLCVLPCVAGYALSRASSLGAQPSTRAASPIQHRRIRHSPVVSTAPAEVDQQQLMEELVRRPDCSSCEQEWITKSKSTESAEQERLTQLRAENMQQYIEEMYEYGMRMNDTQRQELALTPDTELRNFIIGSSSPPTPLLEHVYNSTMQRVPYEQACYICGPEQAMLLRTLVALAQPRQCLDVGCFSGYTSAAILEALPAAAQLTALDIEPEWTSLAGDLLQGRNVEFMTGDARDSLAELEAKGRRFDFVSLDADKVNHAEYINTTLRLLRPGGLLIMFGMLLFPTVEDQQAMEALHETLPNMTSVSTAQLPVGCGIQARAPLPRSRRRRRPRPCPHPRHARAPPRRPCDATVSSACLDVRR